MVVYHETLEKVLKSVTEYKYKKHYKVMPCSDL